MASNDHAPTHPASADATSLDKLIGGCIEGDLTAFEHLASACLPGLLGVSARFLEQPGHHETVCRDTLVLAWRNLSELGSDTAPSQWLYGIFASRLYNQLLALHGSQQAMRHRVSTLKAEDATTVDSPTGPRPALFSGARVLAMSQQVPAVALSPRLLGELNDRITAEIAQCNAPLTPTGERVYPPLYDPALRSRMFRSRAAFRLKEGFKRRLGRPFEDQLFNRWLDNKAGSTLLENQGLPRRSVERYLGRKLDLEMDPSTLTRGLSYPTSFPNRTQRRKISNLFIWPGDWDVKTPALAATQRHQFIHDIWNHRLDLTASDSYAGLKSKLEKDGPLRMHHQGILLDSEARILAYLERYLFYMEDMSCFGFKSDLGKDALGIAIDRHGDMIKINKGLHRLAMAQTLGIQRVSVRVRSVHQLWWEEHKGSAQGKRALENAIAALPHR
ncbi:RNA polymerase sigma factor [Billgrantia montanilacus]|uniref:Uncharacterized protein n=1 Tax=Billgrantia montanilacus TaxID=2282305 RepID=A0A368TX12_9GAMM|nr:hypothetical protein [Halomonas montanilacus]RCV89359.1 hypothetical protein DU505_09940 [Halomonas montanilacus]